MPGNVMHRAFLVLFSADFWKNNIVGVILSLVFFALLKAVLVRRLNVLSYVRFHFVYPVIAAVTVIPIIMYLIYNPAIVRVIIYKDTEPLAGLLVNAFAFLYLNFYISVGSTLLDIILKRK